ncbi:MAG: hypothetical protein WBP59_17115 [Ilumatobacteraceae bacterium]
MNVVDTARAIGLNAVNGEVAGTIDQEKVLSALEELRAADPANGDLFEAAAERVRLTRSAGVEVHDVGRSATLKREQGPTQLRYRSEMADLFTDLAIDVGIRHHRALVDVV